jgi:hypothetical protein
MKIMLNDALSLLSKYVEERTQVLGVFVTPSLSVARVTGPIQIAVVADIPRLFIGAEDRDKSDQIRFNLSDCVFEYGDFREDEGEDKYEGFLVVASSMGETLSLFEPKAKT